MLRTFREGYPCRWVGAAVRAMSPTVGGWPPFLVSVAVGLLSAGFAMPTAISAALYPIVKAIVITLITLFVVQLVLAPARMDKERADALAASALERRRLQDQLDDRHRRQAQVNALGKFMQEGLALQARCQDPEPTLHEEADRWGERVERYLADNLGPSYVPRFANFAGLPTPMATYVWPENARVWGGLDTRLTRLEQFIQELSS